MNPSSHKNATATRNRGPAAKPAVRPPEAPDMKKGTYVNDTAMWLDTYMGLARSFGTLDSKTIGKNLGMGLEKIPAYECRVSLEAMTFVATYMPVMFGLLAMDENKFRDSVMRALAMEIKLDDLAGPVRAATRSHYQTTTAPSGTHYIEIGVSMFSYDVMFVLFNIVTENFAKLNGTSFSAAVDRAVKSYTDEDRLAVGLILSNFVYFIRAIMNNYDFWNDMSKRMHDTERRYGFSLS